MSRLFPTRMVVTGFCAIAGLLGSAVPAVGIPLFSDPYNYPAGDYPLSVAVGDLNGGEWLDLAVANFISGTVSVLLNQSGWLPGDVDGDGDVDSEDLAALLANYGVGP